MKTSRTPISYLRFVSLFALGAGGAACLLQGCAPLLIAGVAGGGTAVGMARQDQGLHNSMKDKAIKSRVKSRILSELGMSVYKGVDVNVFEGGVLLTGFVSDETTRSKIKAIVKDNDGLRNVFDELNVGPDQSFGEATADGWITTKINTELMFQQGLHSSNFMVTTCDGVVYLMGVAQSKKELTDALTIIRTKEGVRKVVDITRMRDDILPPAQVVAKLSAEEEAANKAAGVPVEKISASIQPPALTGGNVWVETESRPLLQESLQSHTLKSTSLGAPVVSGSLPNA